MESTNITIAKLVYQRYFKDFAQHKEDLIQEASVRLWERRPEYDKSKSEYQTWAWTVSKDAMIDFLRKEKRHCNNISIFTEIVDDKSYIDILTVEQDTADLELQKYIALLNTVRRRITKLDGRPKKIIEMYMRRRSYQEIADCVGIAKQNVGECVKAFRKSIARDLGLDIEW